MDPRAKQAAKDALAALGFSGQDVRQARAWLRARQAALRSRAGIERGVGVVWTRPGRTELLPVDVPRAGAGQITIEVTHSFVSPGTERAQLLRLPNATVQYPFRPGYSLVGEVVAVGAGVDGFEIGDRAAVGGTPHQSLATVEASAAFAVPDTVGSTAAAMIELAVIAGQGVRAGEPVEGEAIVVFGTGLVGALALRLARLQGAGPSMVVAGSAAKQHVAVAGGADRFVVAGDEQIEAVAPLAIEATSDPAVVLDAVAATTDGGRVVLLGSPRGAPIELDLGELASRRVRLVGAHIRNVATESIERGIDVRRQLGEQFIGGLASGRLVVDDLVDDVVSPADAALLYRRLADDRGLIGVAFDWTRLPSERRRHKVSIVTPPVVREGGHEFTRPPARRTEPPVTPVLPTAGSVRFGVVGCGEISLQNAAGIAAAPNAELTACFDTNGDLAADLVERYGGVAVASLVDLVNRTDVDVVIVSVPHHLHRPVAVAAIEAGKHVVVEKPLANDLDEGRKILDAADEAGVSASICFPHRFDRRVMAAKELIDAGAVGTVVGATVTFYQDKPPSYWQGGYSGRSSSTWRMSKERSGGGVLIMNATHYLDLLCHLVGDDVVSVTAMIGDEPGREVEHMVSASLRFAGGGIASLTTSSSVSGTRYDELRIWGSDGHVEVFPTPRVFPLRAVADLAPGRWQALGPEEAGSYRAAYFAHLAAAIAGGTPPPVDSAAALLNQTLVQGLYDAAGSGATVNL